MLLNLGLSLMELFGIWIIHVRVVLPALKHPRLLELKICHIASLAPLLFNGARLCWDL
jgi:hypothetical protein